MVSKTNLKAFSKNVRDPLLFPNKYSTENPFKYIGYGSRLTSQNWWPKQFFPFLWAKERLKRGKAWFRGFVLTHLLCSICWEVCGRGIWLIQQPFQLILQLLIWEEGECRTEVDVWQILRNQKMTLCTRYFWHTCYLIHLALFRISPHHELVTWHTQKVIIHWKRFPNHTSRKHFYSLVTKNTLKCSTDRRLFVIHVLTNTWLGVWRGYLDTLEKPFIAALSLLALCKMTIIVLLLVDNWPILSLCL